LLTEKEDSWIVTNKEGQTTIMKSDVDQISDTYNSFMKNVFNQRQLGYKITANSLYGQCGARTSAFYDKDIAASTTATGRKLLIYGKKLLKRFMAIQFVRQNTVRYKVMLNISTVIQIRYSLHFI
jgi:DNA polymerase elongation subunit (family B)